MNRVLIVEDSPTQAVMLRAVLEEAQLEALVAGDAERALELLHHESVDLVISDVVMPGKSGYELCREIKADPELRRIPIVLLTSLNEPMDIIRGLECGADNFLTKPYRPEQLIARVEQILQSRKLRASAAVLGIEIMFLGKHFTINSEKEQILDLLISTFEDTVQANRELQRHRAELAAAKIKLEEYARALEGQVRLSEEKYALLMENANVGIFVCGLDGKILEVNRETEKILDRPLVEIIGRNLGEFMAPPNETFVEHWQRFVNEGSGRLGSASVERPDGESMYVTLNASRVHLGDLDVLQVIAADITERTLLEEQLRHAQRLEAMGQLTGGIAHDFNNLLGVIIGNLDLLTIKEIGDSKKYVENALEAGLRGANLIKQLLAFARRQPLAPERIAIDDRLPLTMRLLQSAVGNNIELQQRVQPGTRPIVADAAQLDSVILNLAVNARDAMPNGGTITIEVFDTKLDEEYASLHSEVAPGDYLMIAVSDNGMGMTPEIKSRVFDPFFTTKGAKGTGLGLSQVFGFVKQSGGHVNIYSEVGIGTTVRLYLPAAQAEASSASAPETSDTLGAAGNGTILLVEDDVAMREIATTQLRALGYDVLVADSPAHALELLGSSIEVDLLLTDIVMPGGIDGRELADRARALRPNLNVMFSSGFTEAAVSASIHQDFGTAILTKPYRKDELARRLHGILAGAGS